MPTWSFGKDAKMYYGTAGATASTELSNVRDVNVTLDAAEADVTTRANFGWKATAASLRSCSIDFEMIVDASDAGYVAMRNAYINGTQIALVIKHKSDGEGPDADFSVTGFTRAEALEGAAMVSVTVKMTTFRSWTGV